MAGVGTMTIFHGKRDGEPKRTSLPWRKLIELPIDALADGGNQAIDVFGEAVGFEGVVEFLEVVSLGGGRAEAGGCFAMNADDMGDCGIIQEGGVELFQVWWGEFGAVVDECFDANALGYLGESVGHHRFRWRGRGVCRPRGARNNR